MDTCTSQTAWDMVVDEPPVGPPAAKRCRAKGAALNRSDGDSSMMAVDEILEGVRGMLHSMEDRILRMEERMADRLLQATPERVDLLRSSSPLDSMDMSPGTEMLRRSTTCPMEVTQCESRSRASENVRLSMLDFEHEDPHLHATAVKVAQQTSVPTQQCKSEAMVSRASRIVSHPYFEVILAAAILSNAIVIGYQIDAAQGDGRLFLAINAAYAVLFMAELALRIRGIGIHDLFCRGSNRAWAYLDLFFVLASLVELAMDVMGCIANAPGAEGNGNIAANFRILRIVRCTRVIRCIRLVWLVRFVRSLRMLVHQITSCSKSLIWAMVLLTMVIYLFALIFTQAVDAHLGALRFSDEALREPLGVYWSTIPRCMLTLFEAITGGISWREAVLPLSDIGEIWVVLFISYICFAQMAVLNVLVGAFCQNAIDSARHDEDLVAQSVLAERDMCNKQLANIFMAIDQDASGEINLDEFRKHLDDDAVQALFYSLGVDASNAWSLFKLLDTDHDGVVKLAEFMSEFSRLRGNASALDMALLHTEHKAISKRLSRFMKRTDAVMDHVRTTKSMELDSSNGAAMATP